MMDTEQNDTCVSPFIGRLDSGWQIYHMCFNLVFTATILACTLLWIYLRIIKKKTQLVLGYIISVGAAAWPYCLHKALYIFNEESALTECQPRSFNAYWQLTLLLPIVGLQVFVQNKIRYNKAMVTYFAETREPSSKDLFHSSSKDYASTPKLESISEIGGLRSLKDKCSPAYLNKWYLTAFSIAFPTALLLSFLNCRARCGLFDNIRSTREVIGVVMYGSFILVYVIVKKQMAQLIDRRKNANTVDMLVRYCIIPGFLLNILFVTDEKVFDLYGRETVGFNWSLGLDYVMLSYYLILAIDPLFRKFRRQPLPQTFLPLSEVLTNPPIMDMFQEFLQVSFSVENLIFWNAVERYKENLSRTRRRANYIYVHFVKDGAEAQINLPYAIREKVGKQVSQGDITESLFDEAKEEVKKILEYDLLPRFLDSQYYKMLLPEPGVSV